MTLFFSLLISFAAVRGFRFELTRTGLALRNTESFVWLLLLLFFCSICVIFHKNPDRRLKKYAASYGVIIALFTVIGKTLATLEYFSWIWANVHNLMHFLNMLFSYALLYCSFAYISFDLLKKQKFEKGVRIQGSGVRNSDFYDALVKPDSDHKFEKIIAHSRNVSIKKVLVFWGVLLIFYIPWWLYWFPGILSDDSGAQIQDALTVNTLSDWNPAFVTLMIRAVILPVKQLTGSITVAVGVCTFLQMMILTFVFALSMERICRYVHNKTLLILIFLYFAVYPVNNIYSVTMWKDILFSACFLGFVLCLDRCAENEREFFSKKSLCFLLFFTMAMMPLLRHNGLFITIVMAAYLPFRFKSCRKKTIAVCCSALLLAAGWKLLLLPNLQTASIPSGEYLSVPLQQITRVLVKRYEDLSPETVEEIQSYFIIPDIRTEYAEKTVDPVKRYFRNDYFAEDRGRFFDLWFRLGKTYPVEYAEAFLHNNYGYWYPETTWWITMSGIQIKDDIEGLHYAPILKLGIIDKINQWYTSKQYEKTPVLPLLFKPGACFWLWVFCGVSCRYQNRKKFVLFIPGFLLWFIILWSPVYCEFRYVYALFITLPLFLSAALTGRQET